MPDDTTVVIRGLDEFRAAVDRLILRTTAANRAAVTAAGHAVEASIKAQFTQAHKKGTPTPSAPGSPPAVISGTLRRSTRVYDVEPVGVSGYGAKVGPSAIYARIQELGGEAGRDHRSHLPARPSVQPGFDQVRDSLLDVYRRAWGTAIS